MRRGFLDVMAAVSPLGVAAQLEGGYRASQTTSLYGFARGEADWRGDWAASVGLGVRW